MGQNHKPGGVGARGWAGGPRRNGAQVLASSPKLRLELLGMDTQSTDGWTLEEYADGLIALGEFIKSHPDLFQFKSYDGTWRLASWAAGRSTAQ